MRKPIKLTQGASKEQQLLERELKELIKKHNMQESFILAFGLSIIGLPIAIIIHICTRKTRSRLKELEMKIDEISVRNAPVIE